MTGGAISASILTTLAIDDVVARYTQAGARTHLSDALGSAFALAKDDQSIQAFYAYSPYGEAQVLGDDEGNPIQYIARENDNSGLYFYRSRYYDPVLKRFIAEDPIGLNGGLNMHAYVDGDPISRYDPLGLWAWGDPIDQDIVDAVTGFGDGAYAAVTLGLGDLQDIRNLAGIDGNINRSSALYCGSTVAGNIVGGIALGGAAASEAGLSAWVRRYPRAGGGGVGVDRYGENVIRADWHKFKSGGEMVNRPHIDIPGVVRHWPWKR